MSSPQRIESRQSGHPVPRSSENEERAGIGFGGKPAVRLWRLWLLFTVVFLGSGLAGVAGVSFVNEVMPQLARAGCSNGSCHAKPEGQGNFKLSVFGYDPRQDYEEIARDVRGRRLFFAAPEYSLLLLKGSGTVPHEGGARIAKESEAYRAVLQWIGEGAGFDGDEAPQLKKIELAPKQPVLALNGKLALKVRAFYSDGSERDVTHLALFSSQEKDLFSVDENGVIQAGALRGEGVIVANFMGKVDVVRPSIPPLKALTEADFEGFPVFNPLDSFVYKRLQFLGIQPSGQCSDAEFLRRSSLDTIGRLPSLEESRGFYADLPAERRARWIGHLLHDPNYARYWAVKWGDLIRPNPSRVGVIPVHLLDSWLRDAFRKNLPYDRMVRELLTAQGNTHEFGPVAVLRDKREPVDASGFVSQIFLGVRMECAKCHHHPSEKWGQEDYYQLAAFFGKMRSRGQGISTPISGEAELWWYDAKGRGVKHPVTDVLLSPKLPDGAEIPYQEGVDPRVQLVDWMVRPENPFFAKAIVNRIWADFMGRGFVEPVDDFRVSNPPSNPELLDWLAADFVQHGFDLKHLMRRILESAAYQRSSTPTASNVLDGRNYSKGLRRRLSAEVLLDAVGDLTGSRETFAGLPAGARAMDTWNHKSPSDFLDAFGRPNASLECPCERDRKPTIVQSLHLMNSTGLQSKLANPKGRVVAWGTSKLPSEELVREIYLSALAREPDPGELEVALKHLGGDAAGRVEAVQDLVWALINTAEFVFNH
ncbi:MAG: DUF1553 domain-containing protein [Verrucomicrobia bacterium]|nr:DUF1553 domain-containing protein [Verrucomicrobiota bacterium]